MLAAITLGNVLWFAICTVIAALIVNHSKLPNISMIFLIPLIWIGLAIGLFFAKIVLWLVLILLIIGAFMSVFSK